MIDRLLKAAIAQSPKSVLLLGPRQTGKSTLLSSLEPDLTINLASETEFLRYSTDPELFESVINERNPKTIFIDEVQRIPSLLNSVQAIIDQSKTKKPVQFYLSGSSARKLKRGQANLLPGRIFSYQMAGLCAKELNYKIDLKKALSFGLLPEPYLESHSSISRKLLETYSATYLKEEIQAEALARSIPGFARFLGTIAQVSGSIVDFSKLSLKAKVSRTSTVRFIEILEDTMIAQRVPIFEGAQDADTIKHPKLYFFDVGVLNGLIGNFESSPDRMGVLFEHFIYSQIQNSAQALDQRIEISFFRTRHGLEVDFIIKLNGKVWAIEVKSGQIHSSDLTGLRAFREYYPQVHRCIAVAPKEKRRSIDKILICDWKDLLLELGL
jgi:predicted AAA+ superfamily ATPase